MKFKVGASIISGAFIFSWFPYFWIVTIPAIIVGAILIWCSKARFNLKLSWSVIPILLWYPYSILSLSLIGSYKDSVAQKLDIIFYQGYQGSVGIFYGIPCGQKIEVIKGREILRVPMNGILLYQGNIREGRVEHNYYVEDSIGNLHRLNNLSELSSKKSNNSDKGSEEIRVELVGMGGGGSYVPDTVSYKILSLKIGTENKIKSILPFEHHDSIMNQALGFIRECNKSDN